MFIYNRTFPRNSKLFSLHNMACFVGLCWVLQPYSVCKILGTDSGSYEEVYIVGYNTLYSIKRTTRRDNPEDKNL
jgi:hypothetical protein